MEREVELKNYGEIVFERYLNIMNKHHEQFRLTPSSRSRLTVDDSSKENNPM